MILLVWLFLLVACQPAAKGPELRVQEPWIRSVSVGDMQHSASDMAEQTTSDSSGQTSAAYMIIRNSGSEADQLIKVESDIADRVEIHISEMKGDVMTMRPVDKIEIPSNGMVELAPGGLHIMLTGIHRNLLDGEKVKLILQFEKSGPIPVEAEVRKP